MFNNYIPVSELQTRRNDIRREVHTMKTISRLSANGKSFLEKVQAVVVLFLAM
jgi:hypothetical protein